MNSQSTELASLLGEIRHGSREAESLLMEVVYNELKRLAARRMRNERGNHTLQTTAVVHEAYIRLASGGLGNPGDRHHFFALAARQMRSVLVDHARARAASKRGDGAVQVELADDHRQQAPMTMDVLAVDEALERLQKKYSRVAQVVECKFFVGYTDEEIAGILDVSLITVRRDWSFAKAWFRREFVNKAGANSVSFKAPGI
jgi:RNA polymerase sigma factor (TIGR02999 family)